MKDAISILQDIFKTVNAMNEFAEKKNAALFTFNAALSFALIRIYHPSDMNTLSIISILISVSNCIICIVSFFPRLNIKKNESNDFYGNMYYFKDIANSSPMSFHRRIAAHTKSSYCLHSIEYDLCVQIHNNSKIVLNKFIYFKRSLAFTAIGFLFSLTAAITR